ncbi:MAG: hypothetical protein V4493_02550 [Pseudomonadota bacterium]
MEKQLEYFDVLANTQKQVLGNILTAQKDLREQWLEAVGKAHTALTSIPGLPETAQTKEALNQYNTWFNTAVSNSKQATDEALKIQNNWLSAYDKQVAISRDVLKNFVDLASSVKDSVKTKAA